MRQRIFCSLTMMGRGAPLRRRTLGKRRCGTSLPASEMICFQRRSGNRLGLSSPCAYDVRPVADNSIDVLLRLGEGRNDQQRSLSARATRCAPQATY